MPLPPWIPLLVAAAPARAAGDCDQWGQVSPTERIVYVGESATFYVVGGRSCGDVDTCVWSVDDDLGTLSAATGSPVEWQAPDELADCLPVELRIYVQCEGAATGSAIIDFRCTDEDLALLRASRGSTVAGGGCTTSTGDSAALLLPLAFWSRRRIRRT